MGRSSGCLRDNGREHMHGVPVPVGVVAGVRGLGPRLDGGGEPVQVLRWACDLARKAVDAAPGGTQSML
jgi:hypothetical protein